MGSQVDSFASDPGPPREETAVRFLLEAALALAQQRDPEAVAQTAANFARTLTSAEFSAFLFPSPDSSAPHKFSGLRPETLPGPLHVLVSALAPPPEPPSAASRSGDGRGAAHSTALEELPPGYPQPNSYLAVPVRGRSGERLAHLVVAHTAPEAFSAESESHLHALAQYAGAALASAYDFQRLQQLSGSRGSPASPPEPALAQAPSPDGATHAAGEDSTRLRLALAAGQLGTWNWDRSTDRLDLDQRAAQLFHVQPHARLTRSELRELVVVAGDRLLTSEQLTRSVQSGQLYSAEYRVNSPDGTQSWVCASGLPTFGPSGEVVGMVGILQDVTSRKTQEAALRQSEKLAATGRLAATIAHEINNPLEAITNLIYLARTDPLTPTAVQRQLEIADGELARVAQIAQQTLGFYRDTSRPADIDLNTLLAEVVDLFSRHLVRKNLRCTVDLDPDLRIFGLRGEVRQVFSNLLVNAIDASSTGTIRLRGRRSLNAGRKGISVLISDQGAGIPPSIRPRLFSPFFTTKESVGTGLGLWVTRNIVEKQGGVVRFRSRVVPPTGTVFRVFLPILNRASTATAPSGLIQ
jgi:signal transduction histidine kinase